MLFSGEREVEGLQVTQMAGDKGNIQVQDSDTMATLPPEPLRAVEPHRARTGGSHLLMGSAPGSVPEIVSPRQFCAHL